MGRKRRNQLLGLLSCSIIIAAACGSDSGSSSDTTAGGAATTAAGAETSAGDTTATTTGGADTSAAGGAAAGDDGKGAAEWEAALKATESAPWRPTTAWNPSSSRCRTSRVTRPGPSRTSREGAEGRREA